MSDRQLETIMRSPEDTSSHSGEPKGNDEDYKDGNLKFVEALQLTSPFLRLDVGLYEARLQLSHRVVLVLIDGDSMPFSDEFIKAGEEGGRKVADLLKRSIENFSALSTKITSFDTIVRVYANIKGLSNTYKKLGVLPRGFAFEDFVRGFNKAHPLCDYVDAGKGKECADEKIKALFKSYSKNVQCQTIFLGGSPDNGYARLLQPEVGKNRTRERTVLIEGPPFAQELEDIIRKHGFRTKKFKDIFRSEELQVPDLRRQSMTHVQPSGTQPSMRSYAEVATNSQPGTDPTPKLGNIPSSKARSVHIAVNGLGQRVDPPISHTSKDFDAVKGQSLCNNFHLLGKCPYMKCSHNHGELLSPGKVEALRSLARRTPCRDGLFCEDPSCIAGHQCPWSSCTQVNCKFPEDMHGVDKTTVARN